MFPLLNRLLGSLACCFLSLNLTAFSCELTLQLTGSTNPEKGFQIERATFGKPYTTIANVEHNQTSFTDFTEDHSIEYWYRIQSFDSTGKTKKATFFHQPKGIAPLARTDSIRTLSSGTESYENWATRQKRITDSKHARTLTLNWFDNSNNEDGFQIERSTDGENFEILTLVPAGTTRFADSISDNRIDYWYRTCAYNTYGKSEYTNISHHRGEPDIQPPEPTISFYTANIDLTAVDTDKLPKINHTCYPNQISHIFTQVLSTNAYGVSYRLFKSNDLKNWTEICYESETIEKNASFRKFLIRASHSHKLPSEYYKLETSRDSARHAISSQ